MLGDSVKPIFDADLVQLVDVDHAIGRPRGPRRRSVQVRCARTITAMSIAGELVQ